MTSSIIKIDGSFGEGGGQILRTSLSLSAITKEPFEIYNIRAGRKKPGLRPQHLQSVNAAAKVCKAQVVGADVGSTTLTFFPGATGGGEFYFDIGTAGSVSLVFQSIYLPLCLADHPSSIKIRGGTHVPFSPCYHYLKLQWIPYLRQIGLDMDVNMVRAGFYPKGNGEMEATIRPIGHIDHHFKVDGLKKMSVKERGDLRAIRGISAVGNLDISIANRQRKQAMKRLSAIGLECDIEIEDMKAFERGTMLLLMAIFEGAQSCYFGLGSIGKRAEDVANEACDGLIHLMERGGSVDEYLVDQLLLPLALSKETSHLVTPRITQHIITNIEIIKMFVPVEIKVEGNTGDVGVITINPATA